MRIYKFSSFLINFNERRLISNGKFVDVGQKSFDVLQFLVENRQKVVTKEQIFREVWDGSVVEEGNLAVHISKLRKLLGATKTEPFIETITGSGYIFVEPVFPASDDDWERTRPARKFQPDREKSGTEPKATIAVLPFAAESSGENLDYLADGLTENIINELSQCSGLRVLARNTVFGFKHSNTKSAELAEILDVDNLLTGRVRLVNQNLVACFELTRAKDDFQIWGKTINEPFTDIFSIQKSIAGSVVESLTSKLTNKSTGGTEPNRVYDPESYKNYLKGNYFVNKKSIDDLERAKEYFIRSIAQDPRNPFPYLGLANVYRLFHSYELAGRDESLDQIYPLLHRAIQLDDKIPEFYIFAGIVKLFFEFDFTSAQKSYRTAIELNPNSLAAHFRTAELMVFRGENARAAKELEIISTLDPISVRSIKDTAKLLYFMHRFDEALIKLQECTELDCHDFETGLLLGLTLAEIGDFSASLCEFERSFKIQDSHMTLAYIGYVLALQSDTAGALSCIVRLNKISEKTFVDPVNLATIYSGLGNADKALEYLNSAYLKKSSDLIALGCHPIWKNLRKDERFETLMNTIGIRYEGPQKK